MAASTHDTMEPKPQPEPAPLRAQAETAPWIDVAPIHCHQRDIANQLVNSVRPLSADGREVEAKLKFVPEQLPFFFDHRIDHLPGMLETNALRQLALASAHLVFRAPMDYVALAGWFKIKFYSYGELDTETRARLTLVDTKHTQFRQEYVVSMIMHQGDTKIMRFDGLLIMMHPKLAHRMRHLKIRMDDPETDDAPRFVW